MAGNDRDALGRLQKWYTGCCDGDWEHEHGVEIGTLDNPGWRVVIDIPTDSLPAEGFSRHELHRSPDDWVACWVEDGKFNAACGPTNLEEALGHFLGWAG